MGSRCGLRSPGSPLGGHRLYAPGGLPGTGRTTTRTVASNLLGVTRDNGLGDHSSIVDALRNTNFRVTHGAPGDVDVGSPRNNEGVQLGNGVCRRSFEFNGRLQTSVRTTDTECETSHNRHVRTTQGALGQLARQGQRDRRCHCPETGLASAPSCVGGLSSHVGHRHCDSDLDVKHSSMSRLRGGRRFQTGCPTRSDCPEARKRENRHTVSKLRQRRRPRTAVHVDRRKDESLRRQRSCNSSKMLDSSEVEGTVTHDAKASTNATAAREEDFATSIQRCATEGSDCRKDLRSLTKRCCQDESRADKGLRRLDGTYGQLS